MPATSVDERRAREAYRRLAAVYDTVYARKDYRAEARRVRSLIRQYGPRPSRTLLDVACGTGAHLRHLTQYYRVTGLDLNPAMLREARRNVPGVRFVRGAMQRFRRPDRYDVITCLFSAIGYVRSERELRRTIGNFARHLNPGGLLLVEPWFAPSDYRAGSVHLGTYGSPERPIARMNVSERRGSRAVMDMHYLVPVHGKIRYWVERHELTMFEASAYRAAFRAAGLRVRRVPSRFTSERGLYLGVRPAPVRASRGGRGPTRRVSR